MSPQGGSRTGGASTAAKAPDDDDDEDYDPDEEDGPRLEHSSAPIRALRSPIEPPVSSSVALAPLRSSPPSSPSRSEATDEQREVHTVTNTNSTSFSRSLPTAISASRRVLDAARRRKVRACAPPTCCQAACAPPPAVRRLACTVAGGLAFCSHPHASPHTSRPYTSHAVDAAGYGRREGAEA